MAEKSNVPYDTISRLSVSTQSMFSRCCCCIPIRIGCFILGYMNLVVNVFQILSTIAVTAFVGIASHGFDHFDKSSGITDDSEDIQRPVLAAVGVFLIIIMIASLGWLIINIACLVGLHKRRPGPIRVYVGFATFRLILSFAGFIYILVNKKPGATTIIAHSFDLGLTAYFIMVYYVYACKLEKAREAAMDQAALANNVYIYPTKMDEKQLVA